LGWVFFVGGGGWWRFKSTRLILFFFSWCLPPFVRFFFLFDVSCKESPFHGDVGVSSSIRFSPPARLFQLSFFSLSLINSDLIVTKGTLTITAQVLTIPPPPLLTEFYVTRKVLFRRYEDTDSMVPAHLKTTFGLMGVRHAGRATFPPPPHFFSFFFTRFPLGWFPLPRVDWSPNSSR